MNGWISVISVLHQLYTLHTVIRQWSTEPEKDFHSNRLNQTFIHERKINRIQKWFH